MEGFGFVAPESEPMLVKREMLTVRLGTIDGAVSDALSCS